MAIDPNSLTSAKTTVFAQLAAKNGAILHKNGFIGRLPPAIDTFAISFGGGGDVSNTWNHEIHELRVNSDILGFFSSQEGADVFIMQTLDALPIRLIGNVTWYRLRSGGMFQLDPEYRQTGGDTKPRIVWVVRIGQELVFDTTNS